MARLLRVVDMTATPAARPARAAASGASGKPAKAAKTPRTPKAPRVRQTAPDAAPLAVATPSSADTDGATDTHNTRDGDVIERIPMAPDGRLLLTVSEAARRLAISRNTCYALINRGALASLSIGSLRRIPVWALDAYIAAAVADYAEAHGHVGLGSASGNGSGHSNHSGPSGQWGA